MIGAGTIISPIIKIVTTVAILGAIYLFFVKPTLDTTESISSSISESVGESIDGFDSFAPDIQKDVDKALKQTERASGARTVNVDKLLDCINDASGDVNKISACNTKFAP